MNSDKNRQRRLGVAAAAMFSIAALTLGSFAYLKSQAAASPKRKDPILLPDGSVQAPDYDPEAEMAQRQLAIGRAKALRAKFEPWARQHSAIIQTMLSATPTDQTALMTVYNAIPADCREAGLTLKDLGRGEPPFSWGQLEKIAKPTNSATEGEKLRKAMAFSHKVTLERFEDYRDTIVSDSVVSGPYTTQLWVSGRITETRVAGGRDARPGRVYLALDIEEIVPPYDFLKSSIQANAKAVRFPFRVPPRSVNQ